MVGMKENVILIIVKELKFWLKPPKCKMLISKNTPKKTKQNNREKTKENKQDSHFRKIIIM